ncbi:GNAT family N-acetyltransferase [Blautia wexlerae]|nr:GNAT family N-acetyltransferase [Blautia wexlerae]
MVLDEGDITNVAVRRDRQKEGIGAFLMQSLIRLASREGGYDNPSGSTCGK